MAYEIGDPNHLAVHNQLVAQVQDSADTFGVVVTLPDTAQIGDLGHVSDHNLLAAALQKIADEATLPKPLASGGSVTTDGADTVHTFTADGTLTVTREGWAEFCVVGPGGAGDSTLHAGGGGDVRTGWALFTVGTHQVQVGAAVANGNTQPDRSQLGSIVATGGASSALTISAASCGKRPGGCSRGDANTVSGGGAGGDAVGQTPGPGVVFHGVEYGRGGRYGAVEGVTRHPGWGGGKASGETAAQPGIVIVRYPTTGA